MLKYFSSIGNMFSFSPHVKIFWVTGTMLQTQKIVFPTLHRACSRLALQLGGSVDRGMRAAVWVEYDAEAEKPRTSFGVLAPISPPPPLVLGPEQQHAANGCRATPARHAQRSTAGGKYLQFSGRQLRRDKSVLWSQLVPQIDPSVPQPVVQSQRRPLQGPSPGWKRLLPLSHLRHY